MFWLICQAAKIKIFKAKIDINYGKDRSTIYFISAYSYEIAKLCKYSNMYSALELLMSFDENNKKIYQTYLDKQC